MRLFKILILVIMPLYLFPAFVSAQTVRNTKETINNEKQIAVGKALIARDQKEIGDFEKMLAELDALREARALDAYNSVNARMRAAMEREHGQAKAKVAQTSREVNQSRREARGERREARSTGYARDRAQARDDRRDLRDDRRDLGSAADRANRMQTLITSTAALEVALRSGDPVAMAKNMRFIREFLEVLRDDLDASLVELGEDRRERREDRRERCTDRRK